MYYIHMHFKTYKTMLKLLLQSGICILEKLRGKNSLLYLPTYLPLIMLIISPEDPIFNLVSFSFNLNNFH